MQKNSLIIPNVPVYNAFTRYHRFHTSRTHIHSNVYHANREQSQFNSCSTTQFKVESMQVWFSIFSMNWLWIGCANQKYLESGLSTKNPSYKYRKWEERNFKWRTSQKHIVNRALIFYALDCITLIWRVHLPITHGPDVFAVVNLYYTSFIVQNCGNFSIAIKQTRLIFF